MSLLSSLQVGAGAMQAAQIGLQVTGNNIANANTPGYLRQQVVLTTAPTQVKGKLALGLGVKVDSIVQQVDKFLQDRLRNAGSDLANGQTQLEIYSQLEAIVGELSDTDLSTSLSDFFNSIQDILNHPEDASIRNLAVLRGEALTSDFKRLAQHVRELQQDANERIAGSAENINRLLTTVADLNVKIARIEAGEANRSDAVGLRDQREVALSQLTTLLDTRVEEQTNGSVTLFSGGDVLVFEGTARQVEAAFVGEDGVARAEIRLKDSIQPLSITSGRLQGWISARDEILEDFVQELDDLAGTLIFEFNKIYTSGQGSVGHTELTSEFAIADTEAALDQAGLPQLPVNGSLQVLVRNTQTGLTTTRDIFVQLSGLDDDTSLDDFSQELDAIDGLSASISSSGRLTIRSDSPNVQFAFADDTSGTLAALGLGTFFTGTGALNAGISQDVKSNPAKFAVSSGGIGEDTQTAEKLAAFLETPLDSQGGASLAQLHDRLLANTSQGASVARAVADGFEVFQQTLEAQHLSFSGVSIDEEAIRMLTFQRHFQAAARFVSTINELLETLVNL